MNTPAVTYEDIMESGEECIDLRTMAGIGLSANHGTGAAP